MCSKPQFTISEKIYKSDQEQEEKKMENCKDHEKGIVCVTGGTGYVASWLIMRLLEQGYSVRATIRSSVENKKDISYLTNLPFSSEKLEIFDADLNKPETLNQPFKGCIGVFHVAHPVSFLDTDPENVQNEKAINSTIAVLKACISSKTVKRIVYTSSAFALIYNKKILGLIDESVWTDIDYVRALNPFGASYIVSKTLAEKAVLDFAEVHGLDLVSLVPPMIIGPFICSQLPGSIYTVLSLLKGEEEQYKNMYKTSMVHIDDVARAHIFLFENLNAKGRYICSRTEVTLAQIFEFISTTYQEYPVPKADFSEEIEGSDYHGLSSKKLLERGFKFEYGFEEMFDGAIHCCKEKGFI